MMRVIKSGKLTKLQEDCSKIRVLDWREQERVGSVRPDCDLCQERINSHVYCFGVQTGNSEPDVHVLCGECLPKFMANFAVEVEGTLWDWQERQEKGGTC